MRKVYEAPALETITFAQEEVLAPSGTVSPDLIGNEGAILGNGTTGQGTQGSDSITDGKDLW